MTRAWLTALIVLSWPLLGCDPVVDDAIAALGGEAPGTHPGPLHRAGQPCLLCHDGSLGDPPEFSVAGTVFLDTSDTTPARNAQVELKANDGTSLTLTTNAAGNFYVPATRWNPQYPLQVEVSFQGQSVPMLSRIGRDGSCASCHVDPAGPDSPGHVYAVAVDAGVTP
jgi:hypothetical protein